MDNYEKNYLSQRPQDLCKMCGMCCRVATTTIPYSEIQKMCEDGDQGAKDFLSIFEPYSSVDKAREVSAEIVDNIINGLKADGKYDEQNLTFYKCKYIRDDNLCGNYENRPLLCKHFPASPWAIVPPGCGFEGWLFMKREETKQKIRKVKEDLLEMQLLKMKTTNPEILLKIFAVEKKMHDSIEMHKKHGSDNW